LDALITQVDAKPVRTKTNRPLTQALFTTGLLNAMYTQQYWPVLSRALKQIQAGDGTTMLLLADAYLERDENGKYSQTLQVTGPIYCLDHAETRPVSQIATDAAALKQKYPPFGDVLGWGALGCATWPYKAVVPVQKTTADGAPPILVVGTTDDPATPYEWAQSLAGQLQKGRLLTRKGQGHTGYGLGNECIDRSVDAYLVAGTLPPVGKTCP
jgi:hypothetical protein